MGMRPLALLVAVTVAAPAWADATVPSDAAALPRSEACNARMERARGELATQGDFARVWVTVDRGNNPGTPARDDWEVAVHASRGAHELRASVGIWNSGQWSFYPRGRWFDNSGMWKQTFRIERYPAGAHGIAAIIEADAVPRALARRFAAVTRAAIDDCLALPR